MVAFYCENWKTCTGTGGYEMLTGRQTDPRGVG